MFIINYYLLKKVGLMDQIHTMNTISYEIKGGLDESSPYNMVDMMNRIPLRIVGLMNQTPTKKGLSQY